MKLLGIDFGLKRVGLALTDGLETMAFPYATLTRTTRDKLFAELLAILQKEPSCHHSLKHLQQLTV